MPEENENQIEENQEPESPTNTAEESASDNTRRRFFTRRNGVIVLGLIALLAVGLAVLTTVSYRYGVLDNYIKEQFVVKMADIGVVFSADTFRLTVAPLKLEIKNATFNDKISGDKLFFLKQADLYLRIKDLYAWQLSRDISLETTDVDGFEAWVKFDENGKSNFSNLNLVQDEAGSSVNFTYSSVKATIKNGLVHFGDVQHKISADAKNIAVILEPENYDVPDEQKRYKINFASTDSNFIYDDSPIQPIDIRAVGIADNNGADISELKLTTPLGESSLSGKLTDWAALKYDLNIDSTVDLTQTSNILPLGTALRGAANFSGKVTGEGAKYSIEGEIQSDALAADNIRLKGLNVAATVAGENSMYEVNGKAVAELLTFEDYKIEQLQLINNIRGTGSDFKWFGELQAAAAKSPMGTIAGLYITDAVAEYKDKHLDATLGTIRAGNFRSPDAAIENLQANNLKINSADGTTNITLPGARANSIKLEGTELNGVAVSGVKATNRGDKTTARINSLKAANLRTKDGKVNNVAANGVDLTLNNGTTNVTANNVSADGLNAGTTQIGALQASGVTAKIAGNTTEVYAGNAKIAKVATDAAKLGSINVAGLRLTIKQGTIEARSGDINAGNVALTNAAVPGGGNIENVKLFKPVFVLEPSGRYRASLDMSLGGGVVGSVKLGAARASVVAENDRIALSNLTADVMDGSINGKAVIALNNRSRSNVDATFSNLDLSKLLALQGGQIVPIEGKTTGSVNLNFAGTNFKTASGIATANFAANAGTADRGLVPISGKVGLNATNGLFNIDYANLNTEKTAFNATGQFDLNGYNSNLNVALNSTDASEIERIIRVLNVSPELETQLNNYQAQLAGNLNFNGKITGNLTNPTLEGRASLDSLILRGRDLGSLATNVFVSPEIIELRDGKLQEPNGGGNLAFNVTVPSVGTNNITVQAKLNNLNTGNLLAALPVDVLPAQLQDFQAQTSGTIDVSGIPGNLQGEANISSGKGTINNQPFDGFDTKATFQGNLVNLENFKVRFGEGSLEANGTYNTDSTAFNLVATGKNIQVARIAPFLSAGTDISNINGIIDLQATALGVGSDPKTFDVNFSGTGRNVVVNENALGEIAFNGKTENQQLNANVTVNFQGQAQTLNASVNFGDENLPFRAETGFSNTELAPLIALVRPEGVDVSGQATGNVVVQGNLYPVGADGKRAFSTDNISGSAMFSQLALRIDETPIAAVEPVSVRFNMKEVIVDNAKFAGSGTNIAVSGTKALTDDGINNLAVDGKVNLRILNAVSKNIVAAGLVDVAVRLTGVNKTARLTGAATAENASVSAFVGAERLTLNRVNGRIIFNSDNVQIENLNGFLGGGRVSASGGALIKGLELQGFRIDVRGNNFTAPVPSDFITTGDAEIQISGNRVDGDLNTLISGRIYAKRSIYNKDIDLADLISGRREGSLSAGGSSSSSDGSSSFFGVPKLDIRLEGRDALIVRNNLADLTASLALRVTGDIDYPQVSGRVTANSGTIFFRKDRYEVQRGVVEFPPNTSIEPYINLQAGTDINGYQITVSLIGELTNTESLNATVRSSPALPQADVISLITTGNLANNGTGSPTLAQSGINTAAEILTDQLINDPLSKATDKLFGLNRFELNPTVSGQGLNPSARLTVGRQINRNLLVTYSTNLSEDQNQILALEYRVSNRLSVVAQYEQRPISNVTRKSNVFSFEVRLRKRF